MHLSERINSLWNQGLSERDIAPMLNITQRDVIAARVGYTKPAPCATNETETRYATINGGEGHTSCRRIPVTLPYSGTMN